MSKEKEHNHATFRKSRASKRHDRNRKKLDVVVGLLQETLIQLKTIAEQLEELTDDFEAQAEAHDEDNQDLETQESDSSEELAPQR